MIKVSLYFDKKIYPYEQNIIDKVHWGKITFNVGEIPLIEIDWDLIPFVVWISNNKKFIQSELMPSFIKKKDSIYQSMDSFYQNDNNLNNDEHVAHLYEYRTRHNLKFAFRGTDKVSDIYIGLNSYNHEISFNYDDQIHKYEVNLTEIIKEVEAIAKREGLGDLGID